MHSRRHAIMLGLAGALAPPVLARAAQGSGGRTPRKVAEGFVFTEGPVWTARGTLLFSDVRANRVHEFDPRTGAVGIHLDGITAPNGLAFDARNRLAVCEMGARRVGFYDEKRMRVGAIERFEGKRLNSPNDLVFTREGAFYFTDPPFGLPGMDGDPAKELPFNGVFRVSADGTQLALVHDAIKRPNGIALSPDESLLYVADPTDRRSIKVFPVKGDGSLGQGTDFYAFPASEPQGAADGFKIDADGNLVTSGPEGIHIVSPAGVLLEKIVFPERPANCAFGGEGLRTLYVTARTGLYALELERPGLGRFEG